MLMPGSHKVAFRVDASLRIGSGHVMRCLTLADGLRRRGLHCHFISREHPGNLLNMIVAAGHHLSVLPMDPASDKERKRDNAELVHSSWLGNDWLTDARQTRSALGGVRVDWLIVDHYGIDYRWESQLRDCCDHLFVIDDLADRDHECAILLDQNMVGDMEDRYNGRLSDKCTRLLGPKYAMLRSEFAVLRPPTLMHRESKSMERLLIFMGGSDPGNETAKVLEGVRRSAKSWQHVDIVVGAAYGWIASLQVEARELGRAVVHVQTSEMPRLMAQADFAVTGGGSVTWEKCALGLPSLVTVLASNQRSIAETMHRNGALLTLGEAPEITPEVYSEALDGMTAHAAYRMSQRSRLLCDGLGLERVLNAMAAIE